MEKQTIYVLLVIIISLQIAIYLNQRKPVSTLEHEIVVPIEPFKGSDPLDPIIAELKVKIKAMSPPPPKFKGGMRDMLMHHASTPLRYGIARLEDYNYALERLEKMRGSWVPLASPAGGMQSNALYLREFEVSGTAQPPSVDVPSQKTRYRRATTLMLPYWAGHVHTYQHKDGSILRPKEEVKAVFPGSHTAHTISKINRLPSIQVVHG